MPAWWEGSCGLDGERLPGDFEIEIIEGLLWCRGDDWILVK